MAYKNKLILGTNKDTYIAADDSGDIVFVNEKGSEAKLTSDGLMQKASGETEFTPVGSGDSGTTTPAPTTNAAPTGLVMASTKTPSVKLVSPTGQEVELKSNSVPNSDYRFQRYLMDFYDYAENSNGLVEVDGVTDMGSSVVAVQYGFSLPAEAWDVYTDWTLEVDMKNRVDFVRIYTMDYYDPNYQNFSYPPSISKVVCKNVVASRLGYLPVEFSFPTDPYTEIVTEIQSSGYIARTRLSEFVSFPSNIKVNTASSFENVIALGDVFLPQNYLDGHGTAPAEFALPNLKAFTQIYIQKADDYDPYEIAPKLTSINSEPMQGQSFYYSNVSYAPTVFPVIKANTQSYQTFYYAIINSSATEESFQAVYDAIIETLNYVQASRVHLEWYGNDYTPAAYDPYDPYTSADPRIQDLIDRGLSMGISQ